MDPTIFARIAALALWASPVTPEPLAVWTPLAADEAASLRELEDGRLDAQRGGALEAPAPLEDAERAELAQLEASVPELAEQRAGDLYLTDRELQIVLWTAAIVAVIVLIIV